MYDYIYFDLDDTLVKYNRKTNQIELLQSGYNEYLRLRKKYPMASFRLLTNRLRNQISYPNVFSFEQVVGKEDMELFTIERMDRVPLKILINPRNLYIYFLGLYLFKRHQTAKVLYLFLKHICKEEKVLMVDTDLRISSVFLR